MGDGFPNHHHLKLISPWLIYEKTGTPFVFTGCPWAQLNDLPDLTVMPGIVNYRYQHGSDVNAFLPKRQQDLQISAGTPLAHLIPMTEKKVKVSTHVVSESEWSKLESVHRNKFIGSFTSLMKSKNKCPF